MGARRKRTGPAGGWYYIPARNACGKYAFNAKKLAKAYARKHHPEDGVIAPYLCATCELYHLGHIPWPVKLGLVSSYDWQLLDEREKTRLVRQARVNAQLQEGDEEWDISVGASASVSDPTTSTTGSSATAAAVE